MGDIGSGGVECQCKCTCRVGQGPAVILRLPQGYTVVLYPQKCPEDFPAMGLG